MPKSELIDQARTCLKVLNDPAASAHERARWAAWIGAEPENREAYLRVAQDQGRQTANRGRAIYIALIGLIIALIGWILIVQL